MIERIIAKLNYLENLVKDLVVKQYDQISPPRQMMAFLTQLTGTILFCLIMWKALGGE